MKRAVVCLFGVIPRSIKYTFKSIQNNVIDVLKDKYEVDIYVFNLNIQNKIVDNVTVQQNDKDIIPYNIYEEFCQDELDDKLILLKQMVNLCFNKNSDYDTDEKINNALRQMYSEYRVGLFLQNNINNYDVAIVCGPDYYIANKINMNDVENAILNHSFYTTCMNDAGGYTNGFYIGTPNVLVNPLRRIETLHLLPQDRTYDYEFILKKALMDYHISREITKIVFFKVRANKTVFWAEWNKTMILSLFNADEVHTILSAYETLLKSLKN